MFTCAKCASTLTWEQRASRHAHCTVYTWHFLSSLLALPQSSSLFHALCLCHSPSLFLHSCSLPLWRRCDTETGRVCCFLLWSLAHLFSLPHAATGSRATANQTREESERWIYIMPLWLFSFFLVQKSPQQFCGRKCFIVGSAKGSQSENKNSKVTSKEQEVLTDKWILLVTKGGVFTWGSVRYEDPWTWADLWPRRCSNAENSSKREQKEHL